MNRRDRRWVAAVYAFFGIIAFAAGASLWWSSYICACGLTLLALALWIWFQD